MGMLMTEHIRVATNLLGPARTETYMGREHIVVPAVLVKEKVLQNNLGRTYLPASDITPEWAELVNGAPAVADHPHTSARSPDVMNKLGVGFLYRARSQNGQLKADVFLDPARASEVSDLAVILAKLDKGEKVEVSTGFPVSVEAAPGVFNDAEYDIVIHPTGFDHLAVFAEQTGACSVDDGCGLAQNKDDGLPDPPESAEAAAANTGWRAFLNAAARILGFRPAENQSDEDLRGLLRSALIERFGADNRHLWVDSVFSEEKLVVFELEGGESGLFRTTFDVNDGVVTLGEPEEVRRVTTFEPVANAANEPNPEEGETMNREQMVAHLAEKGTDKDALNKLSDCQLKALVNAAGGKVDGTLPPERPDDSEAMRIAHQLRRENEELKALYEQPRQEQERKRAKYIDEITYASNCQYSPAEVRAMEFVQLEKLYKTMFPKRANFSGRGAPVGNSGTAAFDWVGDVLSSNSRDKAEVH